MDGLIIFFFFIVKQSVILTWILRLPFKLLLLKIFSYSFSLFTQMLQIIDFLTLVNFFPMADHTKESLRFWSALHRDLLFSPIKVWQLLLRNAVISFDAWEGLHFAQTQIQMFFSLFLIKLETELYFIWTSSTFFCKKNLTQPPFNFSFKIHSVQWIFFLFTQFSSVRFCQYYMRVPELQKTFFKKMTKISWISYGR